MSKFNEIGEDSAEFKELVELFTHRIENEWYVEDLPVRMVRYGLMDPSMFLAEMRERIQMAAEEDAS